MIIQCPSCRRRFELRHKAPMTFTCPKCKHRAPFSDVVKNENTGMMDTPPDFNASVAMQENHPTEVVKVNDKDGKTSVYNFDSQMADNDKTKVVFKTGHLHVMQGDRIVQDIKLGVGVYTLGRMSSDSPASVKIAPDNYMSRVHARMKVVQSTGTVNQYILTPLKENNPVYVENKAIPYGKSAVLRSGCKIVMGTTTVIFVTK